MLENLSNINKSAVIILAGGESKRMGFPKLLLPFDSGKTFIEQIVKVYSTVMQGSIVLVLNDAVLNQYKNYFEQLQGIRIVPNTHPELGRTFSIKLGLETVHENRIFIQNADNPFVNASVLQDMLAMKPIDGYVSTRVSDKGGHPVLLCGNEIAAIKESGTDRSLKSILANQNRIDYATRDQSVLYNIDTPEEYKKHFPNLNMQFNNV